MVDKEFAKELRESLAAFESACGKSVNLFAALKMDELVDKWTIFVAANWINEQSAYPDLFVSLRSSLEGNLSTKLAGVARFGIFNTDNHLAHLMLEDYTSGDQIEKDVQINGNLVHEAYIVKAEAVN